MDHITNKEILRAYLIKTYYVSLNIDIENIDREYI